jgi:transposase
VYELERLRCNLCGEVLTASPPPGVGSKKYDETAAAMIGLLKYGCGLPFNRVQRLGDNLGIPMPAATQWEVVETAAKVLEPVWVELVHLAAQGEVVHIDDTKAKVLELSTQLQKELASGEGNRTGIFTSGVISTVEGRQLALFFTGRNHAGENLSKVLAQRSSELEAPILMCDALSRNTSGDFDAIVANCLAHSRRHFVDVVSRFPDEVRHVLHTLRDVYRNDAEARKRGMSAEQRLCFHQQHSGPLMQDLQRWLQSLLDERKVEPSSSLGGAIYYMQNHWEQLTLFLRHPDAPLDNNIVERSLKRAILHRKNSLFYKTENGAHVGDVLMSLIHTAELSGINPFEYLVALQLNHEAVALAPGEWMPWSYKDALDSLGVSSPPQP